MLKDVVQEFGSHASVRQASASLHVLGSHIWNINQVVGAILVYHVQLTCFSNTGCITAFSNKDDA
eukprot:m.1564612 g.1564612  ORF g.1564612 m.1564612 type:complete len:65 (-) comp25286_c1_seq11:26-220(-)